MTTPPTFDEFNDLEKLFRNEYRSKNIPFSKSVEPSHRASFNFG
jgi:hypothetical protein